MYGADTLRLYEMFIAPPEKEIEWTDTGLEGSHRFLCRVWRLVEPFGSVIDIPVPKDVELSDDDRALRCKIHVIIDRVSVDLDRRVHLNTAVSALMELVNELYSFCEREQIGAFQFAQGDRGDLVCGRKGAFAVAKEGIEALVLMISPFTPHLAEELWEILGHANGISSARWPIYDPDIAMASEIVVPVQVNGKVRTRLTTTAEISDDELRAEALNERNIKEHIKGKEIIRVVVVSKKLVNVVVR
jgi:leucyl-tRNA synthetase